MSGKKMIFDSRHGQDLNEGRGNQISLNQTTEVKCEQCGETLFNLSYQIRKAPALLTGASQDLFSRIPVFRCAKCGHINKEGNLQIGE